MKKDKSNIHISIGGYNEYPSFFAYLVPVFIVSVFILLHKHTNHIVTRIERKRLLLVTF